MSDEVFLKDFQSELPFQGAVDLLAEAIRDAVEISVHTVLKMVVPVAECFIKVNAPLKPGDGITDG
ncbi:hypothetical protein GCM10023116_50820 [Kistimonas scapharcae]|uniref:Uncharacterized protein n=1 Tax=Kistimonas scapharcae TaxID=1036133 RepID=A0ABP8V953_9GAMM